MQSVHAEKGNTNASQAIANHDNGAKGISMPAIPVLQQKEPEHDDTLQLHPLTIQRRLDEEQGPPVQGRFNPSGQSLPVQMQQSQPFRSPPKASVNNAYHNTAQQQSVIQSRFVTQRRETGTTDQTTQFKRYETNTAPIQKKANNTGLPDNLKSGIENLSGFSMDDTRVHYNSSQPAQLNAHAYAQGSDIHIGPGQEKHLPHEAWHVVQQKQGRVQATMQMKGNVPVNDDAGLESEADVMGTKAVQMKVADIVAIKSTKERTENSSNALATQSGGARAMPAVSALQKKPAEEEDMLPAGALSINTPRMYAPAVPVYGAERYAQSGVLLQKKSTDGGLLQPASFITQNKRAEQAANTVSKYIPQNYSISVQKAGFSGAGPKKRLQNTSHLNIGSSGVRQLANGGKKKKGGSFVKKSITKPLVEGRPSGISNKLARARWVMKERKGVTFQEWKKGYEAQHIIPYATAKKLGMPLASINDSYNGMMLPSGRKGAAAPEYKATTRFLERPRHIKKGWAHPVYNKMAEQFITNYKAKNKITTWKQTHMEILSGKLRQATKAHVATGAIDDMASPAVD